MRFFPRITIARGHSSPTVTARNGYDLSSFSRMLNRGLWALMSSFSRKSASTSLRTSIHSTDSAAATIWRVRGSSVSGAPK